MKILLYWQTDDFTTLLLASFFHLVVVYINFWKADLEDDEEEVSSTTSSKKHKKHKKEKKSKKSKKKSKKKEKEKDRDKDKEKEKEKKEKDKKEKEKEIINNSDSEEPTTKESPPLVLPQAQGNFEFCLKSQ